MIYRWKRISAIFSFSQVLGFCLRTLLLVLFLGFIGGVAKVLVDMRFILSSGVEVVLRRTLVDVLILLALLEVINTVLHYIREGRVRVTFIVDTVLIVMLNEVMSLWFKGEHLDNTRWLVIIIGVLIVARIFAIKFSPRDE